MDNKLKISMMVIVFVVCMSMVIVGQRHVGYAGLASEFIGLIGLLVLLYFYNRKHK